VSSEKALARREQEEELIRGALRRVAQKATKTLEGLYEPPTLEGGKPNPDFNPDADRTWAECTMRTRAALIIAKAAEGKNDQELGRAFGVIILTGRAASAQDWEAQAKEVDRQERERTAIDVTPEPTK
jgi:hypothetical protein